jgi:hypothetical protein
MLFLVFAFLSLPAQAEKTAENEAIHRGPCTTEAAGRQVTLEVDPKPVRHMTDLTFKVTIVPCPDLPSTLLLDLSMPGMYMGKNRVSLTKKRNGTWQGTGVIVRCMSGRKLWQATILSAELGNPSFTFNVRD